jgi:hypothetical protein
MTDTGRIREETEVEGLFFGIVATSSTFSSSSQPVLLSLYLISEDGRSDDDDMITRISYNQIWILDVDVISVPVRVRHKSCRRTGYDSDVNKMVFASCRHTVLCYR